MYMLVYINPGAFMATSTIPNTPVQIDICVLLRAVKTSRPSIKVGREKISLNYAGLTLVVYEITF